MAIYFGTTEITKLRDLAPQTGLDITDLWFGETNVYTVWETYEGPLPATINANGFDLKQYQVWGNVGGVGDKTAQLFDKNDPDVLMGYEIYNGEIRPQSYWFITGYIPVEQGQYYSKNLFGQNILGYNQSKEKVSDNASLSPIENGISFIRLNALKENINSAMLTEGSTAPASFVPFGYEVDMAIGSNILQSSEIEQGGWYAAAGSVPEKIVNPRRCRSKNIYPISSEKIFYDFKALNVNIAFINSTGISLGGSGFNSGVGFVDVPANAVKCLFIIANTDTDAGITPTQVIAAGIWASVDATTNPIYIGDDPLDKDEYIDYQAGKIYRMINGTLTPTDPPVPLPALPTCEGTTIVDYAGSGTVPEKVLLKYRKEGF